MYPGKGKVDNVIMFSPGLRFDEKDQTPSSLPENQGKLQTAIENSQEFLEWEDNWDDEGSLGYRKETWQRATDFILDNNLRLWQAYHVAMDVPDILPGPNGSIDIHWQTPTYELLINIPAAPDQLATFYGDKPSGTVIKGRFQTEARNEWLIMWLTE
jgi:hypothetical protein